jgi:tetratricopeptide (TPR) repeat protein
LFNAVFPFNLSALHFYPIKLNGVLPIAYYIALPTLILLIFWVIKAKHIKQELIFGLLFYLVTILMVLQIIPVGRAIVSERYSYVPYIGLFFIFGSFIDDIFHQKIVFTDKIRSFIPYLILSLVVFYSIFTYNRNKVWKNGIVLFTDVIEKYPEEGFGWSTRAYSKNINGDFEGAVIDYTKAIELNPKNPKIYFNRGNNYMSMEKFDLANADYSLAIKYDPNYSKAYNNRGFSFINLKMTNESLKDFNTAIAIDSKCTDAYFNRGNIYFEIKNFDKAIQDYNSVIELNPSHTKAYYNKGVINYTMGDKSAACQNWQAAKNLGNSDAVSLLDRFCK